MCIGRPVWLSNDKFAVLEETTPLVANLSVDVEGQGSYAIVGGPDASDFIIDSDTGLLQFKNGAPDFEDPQDAGRNNRYHLDVEFTDFSGASVTRSLTVIVEDDESDTPDPGTGQIGDQVFLDENGDGLRRSGEGGVSGVRVTLTGAGADGEFGTADDTTQTQVTNSKGKYKFTGLEGGDYKVTFETPEGFEFTTKDAANGRKEWLDSDADPTTGMTDVIPLFPGQRNYRVDAGLVQIDDPGSGNTEPDAVDDQASTAFNTPVSIDVLSNDSDADNDPLVITSIGNPANGSAEVVNGQVLYTPDPSFSGTDTFSYQISDGNGGEDTAHVSVTVEAGPPPDPGTAQIGDQVWLDANGDGIRQGGEVPVPGVTVTLTGAGADGQFGTADDRTQTKTTNRKGQYLFKNLDGGDYRISVDAPDGFGFTTQDTGSNDGKDSDVDANGVTDVITLAPGQRNRTVDVGLVEDTPVNTDPNANNDTDATNVNIPVAIDVLGNDSDPDGDPLSVTSIEGQSVSPGDSVATNNGTATLLNNGEIRFTPNNGFVGNERFSYHVSDGNGGEDTAQVRVAVTPPVNTAPTAVNDSDTTELNTPVNIDVLMNDSDPENDPLNITEVSEPINGSARIVNGQIEYTPNPGFTGNDVFSYDISDGNGGSDTAQVRVSVTPPTNTAPNAVDDTKTTAFNTPVSIDVLANDSDPEGDSLSVTSIEEQVVNSGDTIDVGSGTATLLDNGQISFTPDNGFSGNASFSYHVSDGNGGEDTAHVTVAVAQKVNTAPTAKTDRINTPYGTTVTFNLLTNDFDPDGDTLRLTTINQQPVGPGSRIDAGYGIVTVLSNNGLVSYAPSTQLTNGGTGGFNYGISDGNGGVGGATSYVVSGAQGSSHPPNPPASGNSSIGGTLWYDGTPANGIRGAEDNQGMGNITVELRDRKDGTILQTTVTNGSGDYYFNNLKAGYYAIDIRESTLYANHGSFYYFSPQDAGGDDHRDSDADSLGRMATTYLSPSEHDRSWDAGITPIALDLNGDGVQTLSIDDGVMFDMLNTGTAVNTGWISGEDAFLAIDNDGDGLISSRAELFGGAQVGDGFAKLASFDSNGDGLVNESDAQFGEMKLWQDANENGVTDPGELVSLESAGITDLNTAYTNVFSTDAQGNIHGEHSTAVKNGSTIDMVDVYFQVQV
ncbi:MAG: Ig-like domain-containing protein [Cyanobacteria bacterium P01_F01_bin.150]